MSKQKQCKSCKEWIDAKATQCPHCQAAQTAGCLKILLAAVIGFIVICIITGLLTTSNKTSSSTSSKTTPSSASSSGTQSSATSSSNEQQVAPKNSNWQYLEEKDEFDGKLKQYCGVYASDKIKGTLFGVNPILTIRKYNKKAPDIFIKADGVVFGHPEDSERVRLKFDDEKPFSVSYSGAADSSSDLIFLNSESKIISKLKTAKTLVIELPIFMEGNQRATFHIDGYNEACQFK